MNETGGRPYPGLRPFRQTDRDLFFGRSADVAGLAELWQANRLTVAIGPVASGKTSLLQAGVLPIVAEKRLDVLPVGRVSYGSTFHFAALPEHNPYTLALLKSWSPGETATRLVGLSVYDFIKQRAERHDVAILAPIDQLEELLVDPGPRRIYRQRFLSEVARAVHDEPRLHLLLVVRDEAVGVLSDVLGSGATFRIPSLTPQDAFEAVTKPVLDFGRSYDTGAAERLITDLQSGRIDPSKGGQWRVIDDYIEPCLLQASCVKLWDSLPSDLNVITARHIRMYGDVDIALTSYCGRIITTVADYHDMPPARLRSWLLDTFVTELGTRGTAYEGMTDTAGMPNAVVHALQDRHLLSAQWRSGSRWYELLNDRLIEPLRHAADEQPAPVNPVEYLRSAERALARGELDVAERYAQETRISPSTDLRLRAEAGSLLGNLAHEREKPAEAIASYRDAANLFEAAQDTGAVASQLAAVGQTLLALGQPAGAVDELRAAADRMPNDPVIQTELALALWQLGERGAAVVMLTAVLGIDSANPDALRARGEILADLGDARDAMRDLDRVSLTDRPSARAARGLALAQLGNYTAANREIEEALAEAPRNGPVLLYAARAIALSGDQATASELARRAVDATDPALPPQHRQTAHQLQTLEGRDLSA